MPTPNREGKRAAEPAPAAAPPATPASAAPDPDCEDEILNPAEDIRYLKNHGWRKVAVGYGPGETANPLKRWLDPTSGKPGRHVLVVPEVRDGAGRVERDAVYQREEGTAIWYYSRQQAVEIQRDRDEAAAKHRIEARL